MRKQFYITEPTNVYDRHVFDCLLTAAEKVTGIDRALIRARNRRREIVDIKRIIIAYLRRETKMPIMTIASCIGLHHSSVIHHTAKHQELMSTDKEYQLLVKSFNHEYIIMNKQSVTTARLNAIKESIRELSKEYKRVKSLHV